MPKIQSSKLLRICQTCRKEFEVCQSDINHGSGKHCSIGCRFGKSKEEAFSKKVMMTPSCWLWIGAINNKGYGLFRGKLAHRCAFEMYNGSIPDGLDVCHNCPNGDNPKCVNPSHLFLGTRFQNMQDAIGKGRIPKGSQKSQAKLTEEQVNAILKFPKDVPHSQVARLYAVSRTLIRRIRNGVCWRHISRC